MSEDNKQEVVFSDSLLEEIAVTVRHTQRYVRAVVIFFIGFVILTLGFLTLLFTVSSVMDNLKAYLTIYLLLPAIYTVVIIVFLVNAGWKSHELLNSCKRQLKSMSTIREMELMRLVTDLRNLFFLNGVAFCLSAGLICLITVCIIHRIRKELRFRYLSDYLPTGSR